MCIGSRFKKELQKDLGAERKKNWAKQATVHLILYDNCRAKKNNVIPVHI